MSTIFAVATPQGKSGVAVIRISGINVKDTFAAFGMRTLPIPRMAQLVNLRYQDIIIDKALLIYFNAPHSFTGEDVVEIHCHGSRAVIHQLLMILATFPGFRPAEAGEFTRRAFFNNKLDLTEVEGLADLIAADTKAQHKQAMRMMQGEAGNFFEKLRHHILHSLSFLEAYIDFPDEDIPTNVTGIIEQELKDVITSITLQLMDNQVSEKIRDGIYIAIVGSPNVGKSSLLNLLAQRDVAIVSNIAGTTRDVIEVQLDIKGYCVILADTAGIREHAEIIEQEGIKRSFARAREADIKIVVVDTEAAAPEIAALIDDTTIVVMNKSDLLGDAPSEIPARQTWKSNGVIPISVTRRTNIDALLEAINDKITAIVPSEGSFITRTRHRVHLSAALQHLNNYFTSEHNLIELSCEELRRAATEIGKITGKIEVEEILGHIFSSFCIGK